MIPRFFVSSTYYDLKHVRERLEKFIDSYGFQPILFESDKVTYQHGKPIDQSAYFEVGLCHIMILLIGGRYGSSTTQEKTTEERKLYDENYISITRNEFETATSKNIPIMIFIEKNVYAEYETYKENQSFFDNNAIKEIGAKQFKFAHVDHINVFKFIDTVKSKPIKTFDKVEEIEAYIKSQLAGMFYLYLESLKQSQDEKKILDTVSELNSVTQRMNEMLRSVGKEILGQNAIEYKIVIDNQFDILIDFFKSHLYSQIAFVNDYPSEEISDIILEKATKIIYEKVLNVEFPEVSDALSHKLWSKKYYEISDQITSDVKNELLLVSEKLEIKNINVYSLNNEFRKKVLPFIKDSLDESKILAIVKQVLRGHLEELPF